MHHRASLFVLASLFCGLLAGCGSTTDAIVIDDLDASSDLDGSTDTTGNTDASLDAIDSVPSDGATSDPRSAFEAAGFTATTGSFEIVDLSGCCAKGSTCAGNNPSSPYATYRLPRAPGQTVANPGELADGTSTRWFLGEDEAIVWIGTLPPKAKYLGFTNYLFGRVLDTGKRSPVFASLDETLNEQVIAHAGPAGSTPFGTLAAVIHTPDTGTATKVRAALVASGIPDSAINVLPIDAVTSRPGFAENADDYGMLFRVALFDDAALGNAWLAKPPASVYRLTPKASGTASPYGLPTPRPKDLTAVEDATLGTAVDDLQKAIVAKYLATHAATPFEVDEGKPDPYACIAGKAVCAGDNRDALYPKTSIPFKWLEEEDDFLMVFGVDHTATGKAVYTSASVYALDNLVGIASVTSAQWGGSAKDYVSSSSTNDKLFAWKIARKCGSETHCLEIPAGDCPSGMSAGQLAAIAFRVYVEPKTSTAPDPSTLVRERVVRFRKR